jgi:oligopeptidase A
MNNPLLTMGHDLADYAAVKPEHIAPAIEELLKSSQLALEKALDPNTPATWHALIEPLEDATELLGRSWGVVNHLNSVADNPAQREAHSQMLPKVTAFWSSFAQNLNLFKRYQDIHQNSDFKKLSTAQKKVIENALRDFRLGGAELPENLKPRFAEIQEKLASQCKTFSDHVLDATDHFLHVVTDENELAGIPEDAIESAAHLAKEKNKTGWAFSLHFPSYYPVIQFSENRALRKTLYLAYVTRASDLGPEYGQGNKDWDNTQLMLEILKLRQEEAKMLDLKNYAALSIVPKMASSVEEVSQFLKEFGERAKNHGKKDFEELKDFAKTHLNLDTLEPWDMSYAAEKLKQAKYEFSENEVKQYFPIDQVLNGLFHLIETLFQVRIEKTSLPIWHQDVQSFEVANLNGEVIAHFYLDAYARPGKRGGAWMDDARGRHLRSDGSIQTPVAYLVCNFPAPMKDADGVLKPATIGHDDVITLFHEFGHGLHHLLTKVDTLGVSGINGVEWDAVELPSQFMENFCWDWELIQKLTRHVQTGQSLPRDLFEKMLAAKNFQNGLFTLRQVVFATVDWELHSSFNPSKANAHDILALAKRLNDEIHVTPQSDVSRWINTFSHIFAGGYAAGYYSYKWAEVLSADAFAAFEEKAISFGSILNPDVGIIYRREILEVGGSRPASESFQAFRGRAPKIDALLKHGGLLDSDSVS